MARCCLRVIQALAAGATGQTPAPVHRHASDPIVPSPDPHCCQDAPVGTEAGRLAKRGKRALPRSIC